MSKNPDLRVEFRVVRDGANRPSFTADTEAECVTWIEDASTGLLGDVTFKIDKVYTTSRKQK